MARGIAVVGVPIAVGAGLAAVRGIAVVLGTIVVLLSLLVRMPVRGGGGGIGGTRGRGGGVTGGRCESVIRGFSVNLRVLAKL